MWEGGGDRVRTRTLPVTAIPHCAPDTLPRVIDLHCHLLPGLDDGPATIDEALELARAQVAVGVHTVVATSHVSYSWPGVTSSVVVAAVAEVQAAVDAAGIALKILPGGEVAVTRGVELPDDELTALHLGDGPWLLVEPPHVPVAPSALESAMVSLMHRGHRVLIAHPERCVTFQEQPEMLARLVAGGARCSLTATALTGQFGRTARSFALALIADGLAHNVASDAHGGMASRPAGIAGPMQDAGLGELTGWMADAVPAALLAGGDLPPVPAFVMPRQGGEGVLSRLRGRLGGG
jgi:protein-tyrosine phosphatase